LTRAWTCRRRAWASSCRGPAVCASTSSDWAGYSASTRTSKRCSTRSCRAARPRSTPATSGGSTTPIGNGGSMLTGALVRVRHLRGNGVLPVYVRPDDQALLELAERLLLVFRSAEGLSRDELQEELGN